MVVDVAADLQVASLAELCLGFKKKTGSFLGRALLSALDPVRALGTNSRAHSVNTA